MTTGYWLEEEKKMNGMNALENTDTFIQACLRLSVDEKYKEFFRSWRF